MASLTNVLFCAFLTSGATSADDAEMQRDASSEIPAQGSCVASEPTNQLQRDADRQYVEVWIDLDVPPLSSQPGQDRDARAALRARIQNQQNEVIGQLASIGAEELARVTEVRNAIAVRMPSSELERARALPGVVKVRPVKHRKRTPQCSSRN